MGHARPNRVCRLPKTEREAFYAAAPFHFSVPPRWSSTLHSWDCVQIQCGLEQQLNILKVKTLMMSVTRTESLIGPLLRLMRISRWKGLIGCRLPFGSGSMKKVFSSQSSRALGSL